MRSSDLETSVSSSGNATGAETDTAALVPSSSNLPFHNHRGLSTLLRKSVLRDRFQFLEETRICLPHLGEATILRYAFMRPPFYVASGFMFIHS